MDVQKLAGDLICRKDGCFDFSQSSPTPRPVDVDNTSTGIFRYVKALDRQTGQEIGTLLLTQLVTRDKENNAQPFCILARVENLSKSDVNPSGNPYANEILFNIMNLRVEKKPINEIQWFEPVSVQQWQKWMPKGANWRFEFSASGSIAKYTYSLLDTQLNSSENNQNSVDFLKSSGTKNSDNLVLIVTAAGPPTSMSLSP